MPIRVVSRGVSALAMAIPVPVWLVASICQRKVTSTGLGLRINQPCMASGSAGQVEITSSGINGTGVAPGGIGVSVGGGGVAVGGTGVAVGGIGVAVGGIGVAVGGTGVAVGGMGVAVGGIGVAVGGTGVAVGGIGVAVGGTGVAVSGGVASSARTGVEKHASIKNSTGTNMK